MKFYRGSAGAARTYVEAGRSRVDDYYLAEGAGVASRYVAEASIEAPVEALVPVAGEEGIRQEHGREHGQEHGLVTVRQAGMLDGDAYERWVGGCDATLVPRRAGCGPMSMRCGSSRSWSTDLRPGHWQQHCIRPLRRRTT